MNEWSDFLKSAETADLAQSFVDDGRLSLSVDLPAEPGEGNLAIDRKANPVAHDRSILSLVLRDRLPAGFRDLPLLTGGLPEFVKRYRLKVEDASPDSLVALLFLVARLNGIKIPDEIALLWLPVIEKWESSGLASSPARSWPVLASALCHQKFTGDRQRQLNEEYAEAWQEGVRFLVEALLAGYDPAKISDEEDGEYLSNAWAALDSELAQYRSIIFGSRVFQLSLPIVGAPGRRRLVDAIFLKEVEFSGALKASLRNDRENSPLGRGFTFMLVHRPALQLEEPGNWMTFSLDPRARLHLKDLWLELERLETDAWEKAGLERAPYSAFTDSDSDVAGDLASRPLPQVETFTERRYDDPWYLAADFDLIGSPRAKGAGSQLTSDMAEEAAIRVFDPLADRRVCTVSGSEHLSLLEVPPATVVAGKRRLSAVWPHDAPLPPAAGPAEWHGLFPTALRAMGARTFGHEAHRAILDAPLLEELETASIPGGFAVISDKGAFLLNSGGGRQVALRSAEDLVDDQIKLADGLVSLQQDVQDLAKDLPSVVKTKARISKTGKFLKDCAELQSKLVIARTSIQSNISSEPNLRALRSALSRRWGIEDRLIILQDELQDLLNTAQNLEESRVFKVAGWAAAFGGAILAADALTRPLSTHFPGTDELLIFSIVFGSTLVLIPSMTRLLRWW